MRRFWIMLLAVALALVIALPAGAKKPQKPPKPPAAVSIAVHMDAEPMWVHEADDLIRYKVTLENKTSADIENVEVQFTTATDEYSGPVSVWDDPEGATPGLVPANSSVWMKFYLYVDQFSEYDDCVFGEECALLATAEVLIGGKVVTETEMSIPLIPYPPCGFGAGDTGAADVSGVCIWTPGADRTGIWNVTLAPTEPKNVKRSIDAQVAVRDGVPGNWCTLPDGGGGVFSERGQWSEDWTVEGQVYLPGKENTLGLAFDSLYGGGTCLAGGAGGDYFMVGNPGSFYLRAEGFVEVAFVDGVPTP